MQTLALVLVGLYSLLNFVLAGAGFAYPTNPPVGVGPRIPAAVLFALAGAALAATLWLRNPWLLAVGLVLGSIAPFVFGAMVEGENVLLHHLVRAVVAGGIMATWLMAFRR